MGIGCSWHTAVQLVRYISLWFVYLLVKFFMALPIVLFLTLLILQVLYIILFLIAKTENENLMDVSLIIWQA